MGKQRWTAAAALASMMFAGACAAPKPVGTVLFSTGFEEKGGPFAGPPAGWSAGENDPTTGLARWGIEKDESASRDPHVIVVRTENLDQTFNWLAFDTPFAADFHASVRVKPLSGVDDQGGGLVFRLQDANNYYVTRWNPLESNVRLYYVKNGTRVKFGDAQIFAAPGWKTLEVRAKGDLFEIWLDGKRVIEEMDRTFPAGGKIGFWTKADAVTAFDDFEVRAP